mgnify:CR=1 FL=1
MKKLWYAGESVVLIALDQGLKSYIVQNLEPGEERRLTDRIVLRRAENKGMCLNILEDRPEAVKVLSVSAALAVTAAQAAVLFRKKHFFRKQGLAFLLAGAWSNTFDRWTRGGVVDYIGVKCRGRKLSAITYNLADFFIFAGSVILAAAAFVTRDKRKNRKTEKSMVS